MDHKSKKCRYRCHEYCHGGGHSPFHHRQSKEEDNERCFLTWLPLSPSPSRQTYVQRLSPNYSTVHFSRSDLEIGKNKNVEEEGGRGPI